MFNVCVRVGPRGGAVKSVIRVSLRAARPRQLRYLLGFPKERLLLAGPVRRVTDSRLVGERERVLVCLREKLSFK